MWRKTADIQTHLISLVSHFSRFSSVSYFTLNFTVSHRAITQHSPATEKSNHRRKTWRTEHRDEQRKAQLQAYSAGSGCLDVPNTLPETHTAEVCCRAHAYFKGQILRTDTGLFWNPKILTKTRSNHCESSVLKKITPNQKIFRLLW